MHAFRRTIFTAIATSIALLVAAPGAAYADQLTAPITRGGKVGTATAYFGVANGLALLDPMVRKFTPPVKGERYTAWVRLMGGCNGKVKVVNSKPRTARLGANATMRINGALFECNGQIGTTVEARLFIKRVKNGKIAGRALLFSAG